MSNQGEPHREKVDPTSDSDLMGSLMEEGHLQWELPKSVVEMIESLSDHDTSEFAQRPDPKESEPASQDLNPSVPRWKLWTVAALAASVLAAIALTDFGGQANSTSRTQAKREDALPLRSADNQDATPNANRVTQSNVVLSDHIRSSGDHLALILPSEDESIEIVQLLPVVRRP